MANQEHLDLLKQGVEIWNQWCQENATIQPDLSEAPLAKIDLGMILHTGPHPMHTERKVVNLSGCDLSRATLVGSNLYGADRKCQNSEHDMESSLKVGKLLPKISEEWRK